MGSLFVNLPCPAGNGAGAAVDVSAFGGLKTITVHGNAAIRSLQPFVTIEVALDAGATKWQALRTFQAPNQGTFYVAARWMRAVVSQYRGGGAPSADVGGEDDGTTFAALLVPAGNGTGGPTPTGTLGRFKTVQVGGPFRGVINVEISENGGTSYQTIMSFSNPGIQSMEFVVDDMRVSRSGVPLVDPGLPFVVVGGTEVGGAVDAGVDVEDEGVAIPNNPHTTLNFTGAGVTASDAGGGVATINIPGGVDGIDLEDHETPIAGGPFTVLDFTGAVEVTDSGGGTAKVNIGDLGWYGTQIDGDLHFDGVNPVVINGVSIAPFLGPNGNQTYSMPNPPGDVFGKDITIDPNVTVLSNGYKWYGLSLAANGPEALCCDGGDGDPATNLTGGAGGAGGAAGTLLGGMPGEGGTNQAFVANSNSSPQFPSRATPSGGGAGGDGGANLGDPGGVSSPQLGTGTYMISTIIQGDNTTGGSGGGAGGANGDGNYSGGAGGGGGVLMVAFQRITAVNGALCARGGDAGAGHSGSAGVGGSGGGQGGVIYIVTDLGPVSTYCDVSGGAGAAGIAGGTAGDNGDDGVVIAISPGRGPLP